MCVTPAADWTAGEWHGGHAGRERHQIQQLFALRDGKWCFLGPHKRGVLYDNTAEGRNVYYPPEATGAFLLLESQLRSEGCGDRLKRKRIHDRRQADLLQPSK